MVNAADETSARRSGRSAGERRRRWPWVLGGVLGLFVAGAVVVGVLGTVLAREAFEVRDDLVDHVGRGPPSPGDEAHVGREVRGSPRVQEP